MGKSNLNSNQVLHLIPYATGKVENTTYTQQKLRKWLHMLASDMLHFTVIHTLVFLN